MNPIWTVGSRLLALLAGALLLGSVAAVTPSAPAAADVPVTFDCPGPYVEPGLYPDHDPRYYWQCFEDPQTPAFLRQCGIDGSGDWLYFNYQLNVCDFSRNVAYEQPSMTAGTAQLHLLTPGLYQLTDLSGDPSLRNETVTFTTVNDTVLCSASTGNTGVATCQTQPALTDVASLLTSGYKAVYAGNPTAYFDPRTASGAVQLVIG